MTVRYGREAGASVAMVDMTRSGSQACLMEPQKLTAVVIWSGGGQVKILLFSSWHLVYWRPDDFSLISALVYSPRLASEDGCPLPAKLQLTNPLADISLALDSSFWRIFHYWIRPSNRTQPQLSLIFRARDRYETVKRGSSSSRWMRICVDAVCVLLRMH